MQTPPEIHFHGFEPTLALRALVDRRIAKLERRFDRLTTIRVVVDAPHRKGRKGHLYDVRIELGVPGDELSINRHPGRQERAEEPETAIRDAFNAAERRLETWISMIREDVKTHDEQPLARVRAVEIGQDYGFLLTPEGRELYFERSAVVTGNFDQLQPGEEVRYVEGRDGVATTVHAS